MKGHVCALRMRVQDLAGNGIGFVCKGKIRIPNLRLGRKLGNWSTPEGLYRLYPTLNCVMQCMQFSSTRFPHTLDSTASNQPQ